MQDLRLRALGLWADLTATIPCIPEPEGADGTIISVSEDPDNKFDANTEQFVNQALTVEWTSSLWPTLEFVLDAIYGAISAIVDLTIDILGTINIIYTELAVTGVDFNNEETALRVAQQVEQTAISTAQTGNILSWATLGVTVGSWLAINWGTYVIFLVTLITWYTALIAHLNAVCSNLANGYTTVADALSIMSSVFAAWLTKMLGFAIARSTLHGRVMYILEEIFEESNAVAMKAAKWTMIISVSYV